VKFIFATTETEKVPATILSRCQKFDFRNIPTRDIAGHLAALCKSEGVPAEQNALFRISRAACGSMRDALSLLDQLMAASGERVTDADVIRILGTPGDERTMAIAAAIAHNDAATALKELDAVLESGVSLLSAVGSLGDAMRNMMVAIVCGADSDLIELPEQQRQAVGELAKGFTLPTLVQAVAILQTVARNIRSSSVARPLVEAAIVRLAEADKFVDPQSLLERLYGGGAAPALQQNRAAGAPSAQQGGRPVGPAGGQAYGQGQSYGQNPALKKNLTGPGGNAAPAAPAGAASGYSRNPSPAAPAPGTAVPGLSGQAQAPASSPASVTPPAPTSPTPVAGGPAPASGPRRNFGELSTNEKAEVMKDPAIRAVMDLFGGDVVNIKREEQAPAPAEEDSDEA